MGGIWDIPPTGPLVPSDGGCPVPVASTESRTSCQPGPLPSRIRSGELQTLYCTSRGPSRPRCFGFSHTLPSAISISQTTPEVIAHGDFWSQLSRITWSTQLDPGPVTSLLGPAGPSTILWRIRTIGVNPIECMTLGTFTHIGHETIEAVRPGPALADTNPTATIIGIRGRIGIATARVHPRPRRPQRMFILGSHPLWR